MWMVTYRESGTGRPVWGITYYEDRAEAERIVRDWNRFNPDRAWNAITAHLDYVD